jgi:PAS domain S-box-containing protein
MKALRKVDERKNPEIDIGPVDLTCAFVICDVTLDDCEIVFVSDVFEMLTGYNKHEIIGQNCRFLQSPTGQVEKRSKRLYVDNDTVYDLRRRIERRREVQRSLINYRKGGQAFTNLLTMIPIPWDTDAIRYFVGFQVDLVDKPSAIGNKNPVTNTYSVNYKHTPFPRYILHPLDAARIQAGTGQTISKLEVSSILQAYSNSGDPEYIARMWDRLLLENCDDVVHVLSLKGLFQYLSPSCKKVLEYQPSELSGLPLSTICHPSDIVPVMRELKDATPDAPVSLVFRIRRKNSGYTWFESHGSLCLEQGKGRKCIILVGRERPVYALSREEIRKAGWIGENEFWSKISTSGMFLFVTGNVKTLLLDRLPAELVGTSMQALMKTESRREFGKALNIARTGLVASFKHEMINKRGQSLMAETTLYPGDSSKGMKPTFLLAQTRILKPPARGQGGSGRGSSSSARQGTSGSENSTQIVQYSPSGDPGDSTPRSSNSGGPHLISQPGGSGLPYGSQDEALASELNLFEELKTTRCTSWQFELRQMEKSNRVLLQEVASLQANKKKRKRSRNGARGNIVRLCANCGVSETPEWRKGPTGERDYCNACGLRYEKIVKQKAQEARRAAGLTTETATSSGSGGSATGAPAASGGEGARGGVS